MSSPAKSKQFSWLTEQVTHYGQYHNHPVNKWIHLICVPFLFWAGLVLGCYTGPLVSYNLSDAVSLPLFISKNLVLNLSFFAYLVYAFYFLTLGDLFAAVTCDIVLFLMLLSANSFYQAHYEDGWAWKVGVLLVIVTWILMANIGHNMFEGRNPAILDAVYQSLVLAPMFIWLEYLFLVGYRPGLQKELQERIALAIKNLEAKEQAKKTAKAKGN